MSDPVQPSPPVEIPPEPAKKPPLKVRLKKLIEDYGNVALGIYLVISAIAVTICSVVLGLGFGADSSSSIFGTIVAGWLAAKVVVPVPVRILATLAITPPIGRYFARRRKARGDDDDDLEDDES